MSETKWSQSVEGRIRCVGASNGVRKYNESAMVKLIVGRFLFWYGSLTTVLAMGWFCAAVSSVHVGAPDASIMVALFVVHGFLLVITLHSDPRKRPWPSVLPVTPTNTQIARLGLLLVIANAGLWSAAVLWAAHYGRQQDAEWMLNTLPPSFFMCSTVYMALHWAFRPENFLPRGLLAFLSNPYRVFIVNKRRR